MPNQTVLSLDLSKTSTGYAVSQWCSETEVGRIVRFGTLRPPAAAKGARWHYPVIEALIAQLEREIAGEAWFSSRRFSVAIEACIYGESFSEFQFYLGQDALRWAAKLEVDVCTYAPNTLKAWIRRWSSRELPKKLDKVEIERVWRLELRPRCPSAFPSSVKETDDAVDAGWLGLLGLYAQAHVLPTGRYPQDGERMPAIWESDDTLRKQFLKSKLNRLSNLGGVDLSASYGNLRDNKHLSLAGKGFYPFRQLGALATFLRGSCSADLDGTLEQVLGRKRPDASVKSIRDALGDGRFSCALDAAGRLLLVPEAGHVSLPGAITAVPHYNGTLLST